MSVYTPVPSPKGYLCNAGAGAVAECRLCDQDFKSKDTNLRSCILVLLTDLRKFFSKKASFTAEVNDFYFAKLCGDLNNYSRDRFHEWKASWFKWRRMLRHDYFSNPWSFISVIAASALLVLTIMQAVCSILQVT